MPKKVLLALGLWTLAILILGATAGAFILSAAHAL